MEGLGVAECAPQERLHAAWHQVGDFDTRMRERAHGNIAVIAGEDLSRHRGAVLIGHVLRQQHEMVTV
jgi:hypothetical protein